MEAPWSGPRRGGSDDSLAGRTAVVTGGSSGIGAATARRLSAAGASVALLARRADRIDGLASELGAGVLAVPTDVRDAFALSEALQRVHDRLGSVDIVVAGAGVLSGAPFEDAVPGEWADMIDVNLTGLLHTTQTFVHDLLRAASAARCSDLVILGALAGSTYFPRYAVYSAIEAAVAQLTRTLRAELGPRGVRVRNIQPGLTATELGQDMWNVSAQQEWNQLRDEVPPMLPEHVASAVLFSLAQPAHVNVADMTILPTRQDATLPTVLAAGGA